MSDTDINLLARSTAAMWTNEFPSLTPDQAAELLGHFPDLPTDERDRIAFWFEQIFRNAYRSENLLQLRSTTKKHSTQTAEELRAIQEAAEALLDAIDSASYATTHVLDDLPTPRETGSDSSQSNSVRRLRNGLVILSDKATLATRDLPERLTRGRSEPGLRKMVHELAELSEDATGTPPKRNYRPSELSADGQGAEAGSFLDLVQAFARMLNEAQPPERRRSKLPSLSKLVREVLKRRKNPMAK